MDKASVALFYITLLDFKLLLQFWKLAVLKLCRLFQIVILLCLLDFFIYFLYLFTKFLQFFYRMLLIIPLGFLCIKAVPKLCQLFL